MKPTLGVSLIGLLLLCGVRPSAGQFPPGVVDRALANEAFAWEHAETRNFRLFFLPGAADERARSELGERLEAALLANLRLLEQSYEPEPIRVLLVGSRQEMAEVAGGAAGGVALINDRALAFVTSGGHGPIRHELMHLVSVEVWGMPAEPIAWAAEGLGTLAPGACAGHLIRAMGSLMLATGELPPVNDVVQNFSAASMHAYLASASLVEYIAVAHGLQAFRIFWSEGFQAGLQSVERTAQELEAEWHQFLSLTHPAPMSAWEDIRTYGCE